MSEPSTPDSRRNSVVGGLTPAESVVSEEEHARQAEVARNDPGTTEQEKGSKGLHTATVTGAQAPRSEGGLPTLGRRADELATDRRAAGGLNHRFVQIHPFEDGNGRMARLLMSYVFARRAEPTPVITALEKPRYFDALQEADRVALRTFVQMIETKAIGGLRYATRSIENMLEGRHRYLHNGDPSSRTPENGWTRHRGTNGRESVIDIDTAGRSATAQTNGHGARGADW